MFMSLWEVELGGNFVTFIVSILCHKQRSSKQEGSVEIGVHLIECNPVQIFFLTSTSNLHSFSDLVSESAD